MLKDGRTVITCYYKDGEPSEYLVVTDKGEQKVAPFKEVKYALTKFPGYLRNLSLNQLSPPYAVFPEEYNGNLTGTILCWGTCNGDKLFRVFGKRNGAWYTEDVDEEEAVVRVRKNHIFGASVRSKKLSTKAPLRQDLFDTQKSVQAPVMTGKRVDMTLLYITEAADEHGHVLRYAGIEVLAAPEVITASIPKFSSESLNLREKYHEYFGRNDENLAMQTASGKMFVVLPYEVVKSYLLESKRPVKITRVMVSVLAFRGGGIFDESRLVLSGVLGSGEIRGAGGYLDEDVKKLAAEVKELFKEHLHMRSKPDKNKK